MTKFFLKIKGHGLEKITEVENPEQDLAIITLFYIGDRVDCGLSSSASIAEFLDGLADELGVEGVKIHSIDKLADSIIKFLPGVKIGEDLIDHACDEISMYQEVNGEKKFFEIGTTIEHMKQVLETCK